jgi:hypothetical protein
MFILTGSIYSKAIHTKESKSDKNVSWGGGSQFSKRKSKADSRFK